jgi:hypothetical protein
MKNLFTLFIFLIAVILNSYAQTDCNPATITNVEREGAGNRITWTMPIGEVKTISQGGDLGNWGGGYLWDFAVFHRFSPEDLDIVQNGTLTQVVFAPSFFFPVQTGPGHTFTIQIYKGGTWGEIGNRSPGTLIFSQELNNDDLLFNEENTIILEDTVTIDASQELWIGYFCTNIDSIQTGWKSSAGLDKDVPRKEGFGNVVFTYNDWYSLYEATSGSNEYNWCIKGKVKTIDGATVNLYFNNNIIDSQVPGTSYFHNDPTGYEHCYKIEVNCLEGGVSLLSNEFCIPGVGIASTTLINQIAIYPNPAHSEITIKMCDMRYEISDIGIYDVFGRRIVIPRFARNDVIPNGAQRNEQSLTINVSHLPAGVYFLRLIDESGSYIQRFVKE